MESPAESIQQYIVKGMLLGKNVKQYFLSKQYVVLYSESLSDFLVLFNEYKHVCIYMYLIETDAALVSLTSRLALKSCCLSEHMWAAERQSPYLLFECDTAHISQEDRAVSVYRRASCDLETAWPLEEFTLELRTFTGYVWAVHRMFCCR